MTNTATLKDGDKIQGFYHGAAYKGTITKIQPYTCNYHKNWFYIQLEAPIDIYGESRDNILICAYENGTDGCGNTLERQAEPAAMTITESQMKLIKAIALDNETSANELALIAQERGADQAEQERLNRRAQIAKIEYEAICALFKIAPLGIYSED